MIESASRLIVRLALLPSRTVLTGGPAYLGVRTVIAGTANTIEIGRGTVLRGTRITIRGSGNVIRIGDGVRMVDGHLWLEGDGCAVVVGQHCSFEPGVKLAAVEDHSTITVGEDCMFSEDVQVRTSDSHPISADGIRVNSAADITIGDRVWVCNGAMILKGATVGAGSVVGARAVVTHGSHDANVVLAGTPASVVRTRITWAR